MNEKYSHKVTKLEVIKETLSNSDTTLVSILLPLGSNIYVLSYPRNNYLGHTVIDTGFVFNSDLVIKIFQSSDIDLAHIENIFLTHHHGDHCGLAMTLAKKSGAKILVSQAFQALVDNGYKAADRFEAKYFNPSLLKNFNLVYLKSKGQVALDGVDFPLLGDIPLTQSDKLTILACPLSNNMHTDNQIILLYSQYDAMDKAPLKDEILFSGDLWLMESPDFRANLKLHMQFFLRHFLGRFFRRDSRRFSPREQDMGAKEALKRAFVTIRVKPGHGKEFLGARLLPNSILCSQELKERARSLNADEDSIFDIAYQFFCNELLYWRGTGCSEEQILACLRRLYTEQSGGSRFARRDRIERRDYLKLLLNRLRDDKSKVEMLRSMASATLAIIT
jgi:hypothetical protein